MQIYHTLGKILPVKQLAVTPQLHLYSYLRLSIIHKSLAMHESVLYTFFVYFGNVLDQTTMYLY
jgi:hypothetical protein